MMKPFRGPDFSRNAQRVGKHDPCAYCGKAVKNRARALFVEVCTCGEFMQDHDGSKCGGNSQGGFLLGPDCARRFKAERKSRAQADSLRDLL